MNFIKVTERTQKSSTSHVERSWMCILKPPLKQLDLAFEPTFCEVSSILKS